MAKLSQSQRASQPCPHAGPSSSQIDLPKEEIDRLTSEVMRHMLFKNYEQFGVPIRREELVQIITKTYKTRNLPNFIISKAQEKFESILGFDMREYVRFRPPKNNTKHTHSSQGAVADHKCYVLKSRLPEELREKFVDTPEDGVTASLTLLIISIISLCGEKVPEETLFLHLGRFGIKQDAHHPVFGDIKQCIESIIKQRYIVKEKVSNPDGDTFVYELAEKSLDQAVKSKLESFIAKVVRKDGAVLDVPME